MGPIVWFLYFEPYVHPKYGPTIRNIDRRSCDIPGPSLVAAVARPQVRGQGNEGFDGALPHLLGLRMLGVPLSMTEILRDFKYQNPLNSCVIVYMGSCKIYIINSRTLLRQDVRSSLVILYQLGELQEGAGICCVQE